MHRRRPSGNQSNGFTAYDVLRAACDLGLSLTQTEPHLHGCLDVVAHFENFDGPGHDGALGLSVEGAEQCQHLLVLFAESAPPSRPWGSQYL